MRSEYLGACASIQDLAERISAGLYLTPRMDREECREAIEGPAGVIGFKVEPALVNRMLNDLASFSPWEASEQGDLAAQLARQADQLPLMQHVLNRLWLRSANQSDGAEIELKLHEYEEIGGLSGALDAHGAEVVGSLGEARLGAIESVFRALVTGNTLASAVRRPCRMGELVEAANDARGDVVAVVEAFRAPGCNFLRSTDPSLASDAVIIDISHESLIRQWTPLRQWLEKEARDGAAWRRLTSAEERYRLGEGGLITGLDYQRAAAWFESAKPNAAWSLRHGNNFEAANAFLSASRYEEQRHLDAALQNQIRARNRLVSGVVALAVVLAIVSYLGYLARQEAKNAGEQRANAEDALHQLTMSSQKLESTNHQLEEAKNKSEAASRALDVALHDALQQKNLANIAKIDAQKNSERLTRALDEESNLVNSDKYGNLVGAGNLRSELMTTIQKYQTDLEKQHRSRDEEAIIVRDDYRSALAFGAISEALQEQEALERGYNDGLRFIQSTSAGEVVPESLQAAFLDDSYLYVWFLLDVGDDDHASQVLSGVENAMAHHFPAPKTAPLVVAFARIESLKDRIDSEQKKQAANVSHARQALTLAKQAMTMPGANLETSYFEIRAYLNLALSVSGDERKSLRSEACKLADSLYTSNRFDHRFIVTHVECLELQGDNASDKDAMRNAYLQAEQVADAGVQLDQKNQELLLLMAEIENSLAYLSLGKEQEEALRQHRFSAKNYFVRAVQGRAVFQSNPTQLKAIYNNCKLINFRNDEEEVAFYKEIISALSRTLDAFPKAPSFSYIAADASIHIGELLSKTPGKEGEAETYLSRSIEWFDKSGVMRDISTYSEDFYGYCGAYRQRAKLYGQTHRPDLMLADTVKMRGVCTAALNKYPWDIYLRAQFISGSSEVGKTLFELKRYQDARPYLEYASHWINQESTRLLSRMYQEGLGVSKDPQKAKQLDSVAGTQVTSPFTISADFSGVKAPFIIYIRDWPSDYPYEGIDDQVIWLKEARGGTFPPEVIEAFHKLMKIAHDNKVSFRELTEYALTKNEKDKASTEKDKSANEKDKPQPTSKTGPNDRAKPQYDQAVNFYKQEKWSEAAKADEAAMKEDPNSLDVIGLADHIYHDRLFNYKRAYELNSERVKMGAGIEDFVEKQLTTSRFGACVTQADAVRAKAADQRIKIVMSSLEFACLTGAKKRDAAINVGFRLRTEIKDLKKVGWTYSGTEHYVNTTPPLSAHGQTWIELFEGLQNGDEKKADAALTDLGVPTLKK